MLRMHADGKRELRHALVLGAALGAGALTKSFMVPWAVVCFATMAFALRGNAVRALAPGVALWLLFVAPLVAGTHSRCGTSDVRRDRSPHLRLVRQRSGRTIGGRRSARYTAAKH